MFQFVRSGKNGLRRDSLKFAMELMNFLTFNKIWIEFGTEWKQNFSSDLFLFVRSPFLIEKKLNYKTNKVGASAVLCPLSIQRFVPASFY